jgi:hypothetical protein
MTRKLLALGLLLACAFPVFAKGARQTFRTYDFSKGVDTYHNPTTLPDGFSQNSLNVLFDAKAPVSKVPGFAVAWSTKSYSYTALWTYTDQTNTTWQLARSSDQITANNLAGSIVKVATVAPSNLVGETNAFGNAYFVDQTQGLYYWNGTSTTFVGASPKGSIITQFHNRLWITGAAVPNGNQLYGSGYYAGNTWTTGLNDTDPVQYSIGLQDNFDNVTAEYVYLDTLYLFKHYSIFALYGFGQSSFQISQLTQECGCIDGSTIQTYNGGLKFVSLRGVEDFNGYSCTRISDPVKNLVDPAIQVGGFSQQSWVQSQTIDWNAGTFNTSTSLSTTTATPYLSVSSYVFTDDSSADFSAGTLSGLQVSNGSVLLASTSTANIQNGSFENSGSGFTQGYCGAQTTANCGSWSAKDGSCYDGISYGGLTPPDPVFKVEVIKNSDSSVLATQTLTYTDNSCTWSAVTLSVAASAGTVAYIKISDCTSVCSEQERSLTFSIGSDITFYRKSDHGPGSVKTLAIDYFTMSYGVLPTGVFTSRTFDTGFSSSVILVSNLSETINTFTPTLAIQHSTSPSGPWSDLTTSTTTSSISNRYVHYISTFTMSGGDSPFSSLDSISFVTEPSSGAFKSQIHNVGPFTSWGNFSVQDILNGGNIAFSICSSTNSDMSAPVSCLNQVPNSQILSSTGSYVQWYATFTVTAATQTPTLQSGTVQWFTGNAQVPMASTVWDNRYWLSLTTTTADSANDAVLVLNKSGAWAPLDFHVGAFTQYKNSLYSADSRSTGNIYLHNQGYSENGSPMNVFVRTKEISMGDLTSDDYLESVYPAAENTGSCSMSVQYSADRSSPYTLGSPLLSEFSNMGAVKLPLPIDASHQNFAESFDFTIGTNDASCDFQLFGLSGLYKTRPTQ